MRKNNKFFFLRLALRKLEKDFQDLFLAFESQDNMHIEYMLVNMLMFPKNPIKRC